MLWERVLCSCKERKQEWDADVAEKRKSSSSNSTVQAMETTADRKKTYIQISAFCRSKDHEEIIEWTEAILQNTLKYCNIRQTRVSFTFLPEGCSGEECFDGLLNMHSFTSLHILYCWPPLTEPHSDAVSNKWVILVFRRNKGKEKSWQPIKQSAVIIVKT